MNNCLSGFWPAGDSPTGHIVCNDETSECTRRNGWWCKWITEWITSCYIFFWMHNVLLSIIVENNSKPFHNTLKHCRTRADKMFRAGLLCVLSLRDFVDADEEWSEADYPVSIFIDYLVMTPLSVYLTSLSERHLLIFFRRDCAFHLRIHKKYAKIYTRSEHFEQPPG